MFDTSDLSSIVQWRTQTAVPRQIGHTTLTLHSRLLAIRLPWGGLVWQRPTGVLAERDGRETFHPIQDITRQALWGIAGLALLINLLIWTTRRK